MQLRTRIFRQLVVFALVPSCIVALTAYYFLFQAIEKTSGWLAATSPDRTINSLRVAEARLQEMARIRLSGKATFPQSGDPLFDWEVITRDGVVLEYASAGRVSAAVDSLLGRGFVSAGPIRRMIDGYLIVGAAVTREERVVAAGFILDREYVNGFQAATTSLTGSRGFQNILPGFLLFLAAGGAIVLVVVLAAAYLLSRRLTAWVTTPLEQLTAVTTAIAQGERPTWTSIRGTDEVIRLAESFRQMMGDLDHSRRRLIAAERVAAWQEFARRMAHELKNPLTPIALSLYRIKKTLADDGQAERFADSLEAITAEVARLERMAGEYSSLAQLPSPTFKEFEFVGLVRGVLSLYAVPLEGFTLENNVPDGEITVVGDPDHLHQVVVNLIKNALEFTPAGGKIIVSASCDDQMVRFAVNNAGKDVSIADLQSAKLPYVTTRVGGTGLGLAISEKIIVDHGGSLGLRLREDGLTEAAFEIPRRQPGTGAGQDAKGRRDDIDH
jgi:nitrogen fixation/metabolism regulation signal transduction histidine kinase